MLGCQEAKDFFFTSILTGSADAPAYSISSACLVTTMENGQWKLSGEPRTSTHRLFCVWL